MMHICDKIKQERYKIVVVLIFLFAISVRIWNWPHTIYDINCDEAMAAINAKSIAEKGTDIYGTTYPVYFEGWAISGQSAFAIYIMALFIKLFGFSIVSIRLPILLVSISSLCFMPLLMYRIFQSRKMAMITLLLLAINPWDILQSQWSLDCNFYPHVMLIAVYLLLKGIQDKKRMTVYFSMILFAITLYTYGIALYLTPIFLCVVAGYLLKQKSITVKELAICVLLFLAISAPIIVMAIIQLFDLPSIRIGNMTIQNFTYATRTNDMFLFSGNKWMTLSYNLKYLTDVLVKQTDHLIWNAFPNYGTMYFMSMPLVAIETVFLIYAFFRKKQEDSARRLGMALLLTWLLIGIVCGIVINEININRINIIWYVLLMINAIGIYEIIKQLKYKKVLSIVFLVVYGIQFIGFMNEYHTTGSEKIVNSFTWSKGLVSAIEYVEHSGVDKVVLSDTVSNTDKKDIFIRYGTKGNQIEEKIAEEEFVKYYIPKETAHMDFSTPERKYIIQAIEENTMLTEPMYVMAKEEESNIKNMEDYEKNVFNQYMVLSKKAVGNSIE